MKRYTAISSLISYLFFFIVSLAIVSCQSYQYVLTTLTPHRIEVTKALDREPIAKAADFLQPYLVGVDSLRSPVVGHSAKYMSAGRPESLLSNWVADALVAMAERDGIKADLGICNIGGLRASLPKGAVTQGDVLSISPFRNYFTIVKMRGTDMQQLMHDIAAVNGEGLSASARLVITRDRRLSSATIGGQPIDPERIYTVVTLDYLADGNDKLYSLKNSIERTTTTTPTSEILMGYLAMLEQQGRQATAEIEGRVSVNEEGEFPPSDSHPEAVSKEQTLALAAANGASSTRQLLIVHTNDSHSCVEPLNPNLADTANADKGGYLRRAALLRDLRRDDPELLLFDCGDFSQGSAFYTLYHGDVEVGLMNMMKYDAATIGNHEFDFGLENMARIFRMAKFPIVCCNYDFTGTPVEGLVKPYIIIKRAGVRVGVTGVAPQLEGLVPAHSCEGVRYTDPIAAVQPVVDLLRNRERCDIVVCLSHLGWQIAGVSDEELIPATQGIDVVLGGHSHTYFSSPQCLKNVNGKDVPDNQMGKNARYVGTMRLNLARTKSKR